MTAACPRCKGTCILDINMLARCPCGCTFSLSFPPREHPTKRVYKVVYGRLVEITK